MQRGRRRFLWALAAGLGAGAYGAWRYWPEDGLFNPCLEASLPEALRDSVTHQRLLQGIDFHQHWDCHVHLIGLGGRDPRVYVNPDMRRWRHPLLRTQLIFYLDGGCVSDQEDPDSVYVQRLLQLAEALPPGMKLMLLAFDHYHDAQGRPQPQSSPIYTANEYAAELAAQTPQRLEWIASVHPYREDALEALQGCIDRGARAVKWLPEAMNIDPAAPACRAFYEKLAQHDLPLLCHAGAETAVGTKGGEDLGNPLRLRAPLDAGVRVIVAHCASLGKSRDLDAGSRRDVENFDLFARLMQEPRYEDRLLGDISAMPQVNRAGAPLRAVLERTEWHARLLQGSDYPLPGILPIISLKQLVRLGVLDSGDADLLKYLRRYNPLWFDFALKRLLQWQGKRFDAAVFHTRRHFPAPGAASHNDERSG